MSKTTRAFDMEFILLERYLRQGDKILNPDRFYIRKMELLHYPHIPYTDMLRAVAVINTEDKATIVNIALVVDPLEITNVGPEVKKSIRAALYKHVFYSNLRFAKQEKNDE